MEKLLSAAHGILQRRGEIKGVAMRRYYWRV